MKIKLTYIPVLLFTSCFVLNADAGEIFGYPVKPEKSLTVLAAPNAGAKIIGNDIPFVLVKKCSKGWCDVVYYKGSKRIRGWIGEANLKFDLADKTSRSSSSSFEEVLSAPEIKKCDFYSSNPVLTAKATDFDCDKDIFGEGYTECTTKIDYQIQTSCELPSHASMSVTCKVSVDTTQQDGFKRSSDGRQSETIYPYGTYTSGSIRVSVDVTRIMDKTRSARLDQYSCELTEY